MINDIDKSSIEMVEWTCASCGCVQWMPLSFNEKLRENHKTFHCLNGHAQGYYSKTSIEQLEDKLAGEYAKNAQLEARISQLEHENSEISSIKESLKLISEKANKSFLKKIFD